MNQIGLCEVLKPGLGDEESKALIEYIDGIRREIVTKDILEKAIELAKTEILAKTEKDKTDYKMGNRNNISTDNPACCFDYLPCKTLVVKY